MASPPIAFVVKVLRRHECVALFADSALEGSVDDQRDGFIHLSSFAQVTKTLARHFANEAELWCLIMRTNALGADLRWDVSGSGEKYPHLYRALTLKDVVAMTPLPDDRTGWSPDNDPLLRQFVAGTSP